MSKQRKQRRSVTPRSRPRDPQPRSRVASRRPTPALRGAALIGAGMLLGVSLWHAPQLVSALPSEPTVPTYESVVFDGPPARVRNPHPPASAPDDGGEAYAYVYSDAVFGRLRTVRAQKRDAITRLLDDVAHTARGIANDDTMRTCFFRARELYGEQHQGTGDLPAELRQAVTHYQRAIDRYYALNYAQFYDILFVARDHYVFYSIRQESDFHTRLPPHSALARGLRGALTSAPQSAVIDYHYYAPSRRPAAFFAVPVQQDGVHHGWFVLQYPIKMLDILLVDQSELGRTGEVCLVNRDQLMVTDSRFSGERTHLEIPLGDIKPQDLAPGDTGEGLIVDYRGVRTFCSYECLSALDTRWVLVVKIDEAEVITEYYRCAPQAVLDRVIKRLASHPMVQRGLRNDDAPVVMVDMDEFVKAGPGQALETRGVSTCTAVAASHPGHFNYLAHISPYDKLYGGNCLTNLLKQLVNRIKQYDIYQNELRNLRFVIIAPHANSLRTAVDKLIRCGVTLDQVRFIYNSGARHASIQVAPDGEVVVGWTMQDPQAGRVIQWASDVPDIASTIRDLCHVTTSAPTAGQVGTAG